MVEFGHKMGCREHNAIWEAQLGSQKTSIERAVVKSGGNIRMGISVMYNLLYILHIGVMYLSSYVKMHHLRSHSHALQVPKIRLVKSR